MDEALSNHPMYYNHLLCSCKQAKLPVDQREFVKFTEVKMDDRAYGRHHAVPFDQTTPVATGSREPRFLSHVERSPELL